MLCYVIICQFLDDCAGQVLDSAAPNEVVVSKMVYQLVSQYLNDGDLDSIINDDIISPDDNSNNNMEENKSNHNDDEENTNGSVRRGSTNDNESNRNTQRKYTKSLVSLDGKATLFKMLVKPAFHPEKAGISHKMQLFGKKEKRKHATSQRAADTSQYLQVWYSIA